MAMMFRCSLRRIKKIQFATVASRRENQFHGVNETTFEVFDLGDIFAWYIVRICLSTRPLGLRLGGTTSYFRLKLRVIKVNSSTRIGYEPIVPALLLNFQCCLKLERSG